LKEIFRFSKSERIASLIILVLTLGVILLLALARRVRPLPDEEVRAYDSLLNTLLAEGDTLQPLPEQKERQADIGREIPSGTKTPPPVRDPNKMTRSEWEELPLPGYVIRTLLNYRKKGGVFRRKEDLKKIYGMTDSLYAAVAPYLKVEPVQEIKDTLPVGGTSRKRVSPAQTIPPVLELNRADSADFDRLPGIAPWLARRIVRYRKLLGGYVRKEQLLEVYGLDSALFAGIAGRIVADTQNVKKINVNRCDLSALARHPYLTRREAEAVIFYREHFGKITDLQVLEKEHVLPEHTFRRIVPYLETEEGK
jgi:DNA uptake protein ComE-like DNA-binding protein